MNQDNSHPRGEASARSTEPSAFAEPSALGAQKVGPDGPQGSLEGVRIVENEDATAQPPEARGALQVIRVTLHVSFAVLLIVAFIRTLSGPAEAPAQRALVIALAAVLGLGYLAGTVYENRATKANTPVSRAQGTWWLAAILLLWAGTTWLSDGFAWLAFPLFFVVLTVLRRWIAIPVLALMAGYVGLAISHHGGDQNAATWIGPAIGAIAAYVIHWLYTLITRITNCQSAVIAELTATRAALAQSERAAGQQSERARLSRDIHDTLAQGFSSIVLISRATTTALDRGDLDQAADRVRIIETTASENLAQARQLVNVLATEHTPANLVPMLTAALDSAKTSARGGDNPTQFSARISENIVMTEPTRAQALTRSVQTLLANVLKHAKAKTCVLTLTALPDVLLVDVFDDGIGFDPATAASGPTSAGTGFGLPSVESRMRELGGDMTIETAPGQGTTVTLRMPVGAPMQTVDQQEGDRDDDQ